MAQVPSGEPAKHVAGDTLKFTRYLADYLPADSWVLSYALVKDGEQIEFSATDNGDGSHLVNVAAATTAAWSTGEYRWQAVVTKSAERYTVGTGRIEIVADYAAAAAGLDDRAHVKKVLDAIQATIEGKATVDQSNYSISVGGSSRSLSRLAWADLIEAEKYYRRRYAELVNDERRAAGKSTRRLIKTRIRN